MELPILQWRKRQIRAVIVLGTRFSSTQTIFVYLSWKQLKEMVVWCWSYWSLSGSHGVCTRVDGPSWQACQRLLMDVDGCCYLYCTSQSLYFVSCSFRFSSTGRTRANILRASSSTSTLASSSEALVGYRNFSPELATKLCAERMVQWDSQSQGENWKVLIKGWGSCGSRPKCVPCEHFLRPAAAPHFLLHSIEHSTKLHDKQREVAPAPILIFSMNLTVEFLKVKVGSICDPPATVHSSCSPW